MPNWCDNSLSIYGDKETLEKLYRIALESKSKGFFNQIVPRPSSEEKNWYNWNYENWGTKWDVGLEGSEDFTAEMAKSENGICFLQVSMTTAWCPPEAFVKKLSEKFNVLAELRYIECGMDFVGAYGADDGKVYLDESQPITRESLKYFGFDDDYIEDFFEDFEDMEE